MRSLFIDWGASGSGKSYVYIEDTNEKVIRKSRPFNGSALELTNKIVDIIKKNPDIKLMKIDVSGMGNLIADTLESKLKHYKIQDITIDKYQIRAL